jgi:hypothetical protein
MTAAFRKRKVSAHVREVCLNFHREAAGEAMPETSLRASAETWLATKKNEVSTATYSFYDSVKKRLVAHLGTKADADINWTNGGGW